MPDIEHGARLKRNLISSNGHACVNSGSLQMPPEKARLQWRINGTARHPKRSTGRDPIARVGRGAGRFVHRLKTVFKPQRRRENPALHHGVCEECPGLLGLFRSSRFPNQGLHSTRTRPYSRADFGLCRLRLPSGVPSWAHRQMGSSTVGYGMRAANRILGSRSAGMQRMANGLRSARRSYRSHNCPRHGWPITVRRHSGREQNCHFFTAAVCWPSLRRYRPAVVPVADGRVWPLSH